MSSPIEIFFCYAHEDKTYLNKLKKHLTPLQREHLINTWHDVDISPGTEWEREIDKHLNTAQVILLLISPDFMASEYCYSNEMQRAMERHEQGEACVIPILLRPTHWKGAPFGKLQALPTDAKPVTDASWVTQDNAFLKVTEGVRKAIDELVLPLPSSAPLPSEKTSTLETTKPVSTTAQSETPTVTSTTTIQFSPLTASMDQSLASEAPSPPPQTNIPNQQSEKPLSLSERLDKCRDKLQRADLAIDMGGPHELTEGFAKLLHQLLVETIVTIRTIPANTPSTNYFKAKDDVLENIRLARDQVIRALDAFQGIPPLMWSSLFGRSKPEAFYQCLRACREYIEKALNNW